MFASRIFAQMTVGQDPLAIHKKSEILELRAYCKTGNLSYFFGLNAQLGK